MIPLSQYPRPSYNTRVCLHGTAQQNNPWGPDMRFYMNEAKAMGVSWIKGLSDRDGNTGMMWAPLALGLGLMPVVRIYQGMPWILDDTIKKAIDKLTAAGVKYIETLNEPDNEQEWDVPPNWADIAADNQIAVARYIQSKGGIPLIAALSTGSPGSYTDMTAKIIEHGGADIFEGYFAMSVHNYPLNHPIGLAEWGQSASYPLDDVNLAGTPISEEMYRKYGDTNSMAWEGRTREWVNARRLEKKNPGATMFSDNCGEVNLFYVAECAKKTLGFYPACIVTEGGVVIGDAQDDRYPKNTGAYMRDANVEIARRCMGSSSRSYPDYLLTGGGYWLLHNYGGDANWNSQAWFGGAWPQFNSGGRLWVVDAMKAMPKQAYGTAPPEPPIPPEPPVPPTTDVDWQIPVNLPKVALVPANVLPGETYWKLIKAVWLDEAASAGRHHIYIEALDKAGHRISGIPIAIANGGTVKPLTLPDKPLEFGMYGVLGSYTVYVASGISDRVIGMGMGTPAQPNYSIHTSFELTFQETTEVVEPIPEPEPSDRHCLWVSQRIDGIEWGIIEALRLYLERYRSTLTFSHHDAAGLDGGGGYANVTALSSDTMPHSQETIQIVRSAPAVKWFEIISGTIAEIGAELKARAESGAKYGNH